MPGAWDGVASSGTAGNAAGAPDAPSARPGAAGNDHGAQTPEVLFPSAPALNPPTPPAVVDPATPSVPGFGISGAAGGTPATAGLAPMGGPSGAQDIGTVDSLLNAALSHLPTESLDAVLREVSREAGISQGLSLRETVHDLVHGTLPLTPASIVRTVLRLFLRQVWASAALMGKLILLAVGATALELVGRAIGYDDAARVAALVVYLAIVALALASFLLAISLANAAVTEMGTLMAAALPLMVTLLVAMGGITSAALLQPLVMGATEVIGHVIATVAVPVLFISGILDIVGQLTPYRLSHVAGFLRSVGAWILGGLLTVFLGVLVVAGSLGPVADGLVLKIGKFAANAFIPVIGKMFADATEMVMGTSLLLKNVVGALGLLAILLILVVPIVKLMAMILVYRLAGTAVSPLGGGVVPAILGSMAQTLLFVTLAVGVMALMCFLSLAALIVAGSAGVLPG